MTNKRILLIVALFAAAFSSVYSNHVHTVDNRTDGRVKAIFRYEACRGDDLWIEPHSTAQVQAYGCCLNQPVEIFKFDGTIARDAQGNIKKRKDGSLVNYTRFSPQTTGASLSCTSNYILVQDAGSFGIIATRPEDS